MTGVEMGRRASAAVNEARPWVEPAARAGYAAKGVVYVVVGLLAAQAALGRGSVGDSSDAFGVILRQPLGRVLLGIVAIGLLGYAVWRLLSAVLDTEGKGSDGKGLLKRAGYGLSGAIHAALAVEAGRLALGSGGGSGSGSGAEHWSARLMELPAGRWLLALAAAGVAAYGIYQLVRAVKADVRKHLRLDDLDASSAEWAVRVSRFGVAARGVVFVMVGWLVAQSALSAQPEQAGGTEDALRAFQSEQGPWLLGIVALGLIAYALYQFLNARYRVVRT